MPSLFEPCGLNQLYSLAHGTVPVVRATGGLADTVIDASPENLANGTATGFVFIEPTPPALWATIERALALWPDRAAWLQAPADRNDRRLVLGAKRSRVRQALPGNSPNGRLRGLVRQSGLIVQPPPAPSDRLKFGTGCSEHITRGDLLFS